MMRMARSTMCIDYVLVVRPGADTVEEIDVELGSIRIDVAKSDFDRFPNRDTNQAEDQGER